MATLPPRHRLYVPIAVALLLWATVAPAGAQPIRPAAPATPAPPPAAAPQRTSATYGDWELRCDRSTSPAQCEAVEAVSTPQGQTIAQIAIARPVAGQLARLALIVPASATLTLPPRILPAAGAQPETPLIELTWRRCLPEACIADVALTDDVLRRLRTGTEPYRVTLQDGIGHDRVFPLSPKGLGETMDALTKP